MNDYGTEVRLLAVTMPTWQGDEHSLTKACVPDKSIWVEALIEYAGRLCWDTQDKVGSTPDRIQKWIEVGHESVIEHASATFYIRASRVFTHELVRHRIASYSQRSQRYVNESEPRYIAPPEIMFSSKFQAGVALPNMDMELRFLTHMRACWDLYAYYLAQGVKPEIARYVLPNACETQIVMTMNFRELRHFIKLRTSKKALPEMREVAGKVRDICKGIAPEVFKDV